MRKYFFAFTAVFVASFAISSRAAEKPRPAQGNTPQAKKVWTNDDMPALRAQGLISIVGQESPAQPAEPAQVAPEEPSFPVYASRFDDPDWYAEQAYDLQAQLDDAVAALQQEQDALALAKDQRITQPGVSLDQPSFGVTPDAAIALLQARVDEVQMDLDELSDLARQHNIEPGVLRG